MKIAGTLDGKNVTWKYDSHYNGTPLTPAYSATLDGSGKIAGSLEDQPFGVTIPEQLSILDNAMKRTIEQGPVDILLGLNSAETPSVRLTITE